MFGFAVWEKSFVFLLDFWFIRTTQESLKILITKDAFLQKVWKIKMPLLKGFLQGTRENNTYKHTEYSKETRLLALRKKLNFSQDIFKIFPEKN